MTGAGALKIWDRAIEPVYQARDEAKASGTPEAFAKFDGARETLRAVSLALIEAVVRDEDGALGRILREWGDPESDFFSLPIRHAHTTGGVAPNTFESIITTEGGS